MAVIEKSGLMKYKDESGNTYLMYPITNTDNIDGLEEALAEKETSGAAAQALTDAKAYTDQQISDGQKLDVPVTATSNDGIAYAATVPGLTALTAGFSFIMVPDRISTSTNTTLNVNGLGAKNLRIRSTGYTSTTVSPSAANWLGNGKPVRVTYDGMWWVADVVADPGSDFTYSTTDLTAGTSSLQTGKLYFVYE